MFIEWMIEDSIWTLMIASQTKKIPDNTFILVIFLAFKFFWHIQWCLILCIYNEYLDIAGVLWSSHLSSWVLCLVENLFMENSSIKSSSNFNSFNICAMRSDRHCIFTSPAAVALQGCNADQLNWLLIC